MMLILEEYFKGYPARKKVVEFLFENGLSIKKGKVYLRDVEIPISELARVIGVNRKIVYHTIEYVESTYPLRLIFERLKPLTSLIDVAPLMGWEVLEVELDKSKYQEGMAGVLKLLADRGVPIMEVFSKNLRKDPGKLYIVIDGTIPVDVFAEIKELDGFERLILRTPEKDKEKLVCNYCEVKYCPKRILMEKVRGQ